MASDSEESIVRPNLSVSPAEALRKRQRLFSALEQAFAVRFVAGTELLPDGATMSVQSAGCSLHFVDADRTDQPTRVTFDSTEALAQPLRGATLTEDQGVAPGRGLPAEGTTILAHASMSPVWVRRGEEEWSTLAPTELEQGEPLREHLRENRFFGLLPLVEWLKRVAPPSWSPPPIRAAFLFDDPNLHWPSYGYIRYDELANHAREHEYAATMATIPRDLWFAHPRAVRLFRDSRQRLSLALHGNDHVKRELQGDLSPERRRSLLAQAIRRAAAFESRNGLPIAKVMIPPHGSTSREMALEMPRLGIEAMSDSRPYPWLTRPPEADPLAGWDFVDIVDGGLPVIPRYHFARSRADLPLRALLGQPLILYGHHEDVADGLATLAQAAAQVNALGDIRWCSLGEIARSNFETRQRGNRLDVRMAASVVDVDIPEGVHELVGPGTGRDSGSSDRARRRIGRLGVGVLGRYNRHDSRETWKSTTARGSL